MANNANSLEDKLRVLREKYLHKLPDTISEIEAQWAELTKSQWDMEHIFTLHRLVHNLTGSSATFGLKEVSETARDFDKELITLLDLQQVPEQPAITVIEHKFSVLKQVCASHVENICRN